MSNKKYEPGSDAYSNFWGEMYIELTMLATRFWAQAPDNAPDADFHVYMGTALDNHAHMALMQTGSEATRQHWQNEYHNRYRQSLDLPF